MQFWCMNCHFKRPEYCPNSVWHHRFACSSAFGLRYYKGPPLHIIFCCVLQRTATRGYYNCFLNFFLSAINNLVHKFVQPVLNTEKSKDFASYRKKHCCRPGFIDTKKKITFVSPFPSNSWDNSISLCIIVSSCKALNILTHSTKAVLPIGGGQLNSWV